MENESRTPSIPRPDTQESAMDDAPRKSNGIPPKAKTLEDARVPRGLPQPPSKPQPLSQVTPSTAIPPTRAGTLSWQQRPSSRGSATSRSRPLSSLASENSAAPSLAARPESGRLADDVVPRSQIAESLGSKDPTWFKQTQERGMSSAAYRRNQDDESTVAGARPTGISLPGMSKESSSKLERSPPTESVRSDSPSTMSSTHGGSGSGSTYTNSTLPSSTSSVLAPMPTLSSQKIEPPSCDTGSTIGENKIATGKGYAMSPSQGRLSPERMDRPSSPTKGLGGFVQSAMMKRSDSVSKRWSTQNTPGLSRGNSIASSRSGYEAPKFPLGGISSLGEPKPARFSRENTPASASTRPTSSHSNSTITPSQPGSDRPDPTASNSFRSSTPSTSPTIKPTPPESEIYPSSKNNPDEPIMSPPSSPSKRWSPQKSSWLENALNKPDSPKIMSPVTAPQQPSWMADINKAKQQRGSVDLTKGPVHKQISTGGLMRSPPPGTGYKPPKISGFPPGPVMRSRSGSSGDQSRASNASAPTISASLPSSKSLGHISNAPPAQSMDRPSTEASPPAKASSPNIKISSAKAIESESQPLNIPAPKPKPDTPPKKDFKSTLKSRPTPDEARKKPEPEFKNVFGNLKRTQTQNYKAPDELKDNIMRGKAGLAVTGGPKKTERKDEFKDSIMKKKQGMVAPSASTRITSASSKNSEPLTPEAITKRQGLTRSGSSATDVNVNLMKQEASQSSEALAKLQHLKNKPKPIAPDKPNLESKDVQKDKNDPNLSSSFASSLAGILQRGPPQLSAPEESSTISTETDHLITQSEDSSLQPDAPQAGPQLTHATKGRARGPKRKLPTANRTDSNPDEKTSEIIEFVSKSVPDGKGLSFNTSEKTQSLSTSSSKPEPRPLSNITNSNNNNRKTSQPASPRKPSTSIKQQSQPSLITTNPQPSQASMKPSPAVKAKPMSPVIDKRRDVSTLSSGPSTMPLSKQKSVAQDEQSSVIALPSERKREVEQGESTQLPSVKGAAALWGQSPQLQPGSPRSQIKLPTRQDEEAVMQEAGLTTKEPTVSSLNDSSKGRPSNTSKPDFPSPALGSPKSSPLPGKKPSLITNKMSSSTLQSPATPTLASIPPSDSDTARLFADIYDETLSTKGKLNIATSAALEGRSTKDTFPKIKTLRKQILEIVANGKTLPVPAHQEHILFEDSLYLCTHVFGTLAGQRMTEIYLWCGDGASPSSADDAQLFAKKVAKDTNGRLITLHQGKETSSFFQALGGIVITRRGSSSRADSSSGSAAKYMLCGRQHIGQIAFDEVDFTPRSLCSGFPYIVSAGSGKLYLWKGKGAGADELGCARLIGMDLGLTGEIEEVDEGRESKGFWSAFPTPDDSRPKPSQYWHRKPSSENYMTRLYHVETEQPRPKSASSFMQWGRRGSAPPQDNNAPVTAQIREIVPFSNADVLDENIFVLDAFFEIFVYVSPPNYYT